MLVTALTSVIDGGSEGIRGDQRGSCRDPTDECRGAESGWPSAREQKQISYIHLRGREKMIKTNASVPLQ